MPIEHRETSVLEQVAREALALGADALEVEYRDGHDEVVAHVGPVGRQLARFRTDAPEAVGLRRDLYATNRRPLRFTSGSQEYVIRAEVYDDFGEDAFRVELRALVRGRGRSNNQMQRTRSATAKRRGPRR